jgi:hypothetical protein
LASGVRAALVAIAAVVQAAKCLDNLVFRFATGRKKFR